MKMRPLLKRTLCIMMSLALSVSATAGIASADAEGPRTSRLVMTLGADLTEDQKNYIRSYFGTTDESVETITITNEDEHRELDGLIPMEQIGTHTLSCALVRPTTRGGIQAKTANMNYVTGNMIVGTLSTSGVIHCEVLTAAPFEVSGTGALTGVIMAYETASGETLDEEKKELATEELVVTGSIADTVGQEQATLVVNDIKIKIVRDQVEGQENVNAVVDDVVAVTEQAAEEAAAAQGKAAPAKLGEVEHEKLYDFGYKYSSMGYKYGDVQVTLERVTDNITKATGIDDPITDTFTTIGEDEGLDPDSILLRTDDGVLGDDAIISATNSVAIGDHPAEPVDIFTGEVELTEAGRISADTFIPGTSILAFKDINGKYALMDLNGNKLTESVYSRDFTGKNGVVVVSLADDPYTAGVLDSDGAAVIPVTYQTVKVLNEKWGIGFTLTPDGATENDYDFNTFGGDYYVIESADIFYFPSENAEPMAKLSRDEYLDAEAKGDYIIISDRSEACTLYDMDFAPLGSVENTWSFREYDPDVRLSEALGSALECTVGSFKGAYARARNYSAGTAGVIDRYGNAILPLEFENVDDSNDRIISGGYVGVSVGGNFGFAVPGGEITATFEYPYDSVRNLGMTALYKGDDGKCVILSGDGVVSDLGTAYERVSAIKESKGMFLTGEKSGYVYDLIDWHGNILIEDCKNYSISSNGNYLIAEDGYTSSALYLINGASPVSIAETAGGAEELQAETKEGASLEAYEGEPALTPVAEIEGRDFAPGTDLIVLENDERRCAFMDLDGNVLTDQIYSSYMEYSNGYLVVSIDDGDTSYYGVVTADGRELIPCGYSVLKVLNENWIVGYYLKDGTPADYDFEDYSGGYFVIDAADVYHVADDELTHVTLGRDQIADIAAGEDYVNVQDRTTGAITTYDNTFTAVATQNYISNFSQLLAGDVLMKQLEDQTGYTVWGTNFRDGYEKINDYSKDNYPQGVIDMSGNVIVPPIFDRIEDHYLTDGSHIWANGYFCGEKDGQIVYMVKDGVITCETGVSSDVFYNAGLAGRYQEEDGTWSLAAADGIISKLGAAGLREIGNGLFWRLQNEDYTYDIIDWHGNVLFKDVDSFSISGDGKYLIVAEDWMEPATLYAVDDANADLGIAGGVKAGGAGADSTAAVTGGEETPGVDSTAVTGGEQPAGTDSTAAVTGGEETPGVDSTAAVTGGEETPGTDSTAVTGGEETPGTESTAAVTGGEETPGTDSTAVTGGEQPAGTDSTAPAAPAENEHPAVTLINNAINLTGSLDGNYDTVLAFCRSAKMILQDGNEDAAKMVGSAITLLEAGNAEGSVVATLLTTAIGLIK